MLPLPQNTNIFLGWVSDIDLVVTTTNTTIVTNITYLKIVCRLYF